MADGLEYELELKKIVAEIELVLEALESSPVWADGHNPESGFVAKNNEGEGLVGSLGGEVRNRLRDTRTSPHRVRSKINVIKQVQHSPAAARFYRIHGLRLGEASATVPYAAKTPGQRPGAWKRSWGEPRPVRPEANRL